MQRWGYSLGGVGLFPDAAAIGYAHQGNYSRSREMGSIKIGRQYMIVLAVITLNNIHALDFIVEKAVTEKTNDRCVMERNMQVAFRLHYKAIHLKAQEPAQHTQPTH